MATLYVSWIGGVSNNCAREPIKSETVTTSGTSAQSGANPSGAIVQLFSDAAHYVDVGSDPTATAANGVYVPASTLYHIAVPDGVKIAAITV